MPAAVLAATRRAGRDLGPPALSQATCLGPTKRRGLLRALEPKSCQRITRFTVLEALDQRCLHGAFGAVNQRRCTPAGGRTWGRNQFVICPPVPCSNPGLPST